MCRNSSTPCPRAFDASRGNSHGGDLKIGLPVPTWEVEPITDSMLRLLDAVVVTAPNFKAARPVQLSSEPNPEGAGDGSLRQEVVQQPKHILPEALEGRLHARRPGGADRRDPQAAGAGG